MRGLIAIAALLLLIGSAHAQDRGPHGPGAFYAGLHGGAMLVQDADASIGSVSGDVEFDTGFAVGGTAGYRFGNGIRLEGEYTYRRAGIADACGSGGCLSSVGVSTDGKVQAHAVMANAWIEPPTFIVKPYVGGGIGVGFMDADVSLASGGSSVPGEGSDTVFAWQLGAGVSYTIADRYVVSLDYRWWSTTDPDFDGVEAEVSTHSFMVGGRYEF